jgi:hypothetical protein
VGLPLQSASSHRHSELAEQSDIAFPKQVDGSWQELSLKTHAPAEQVARIWSLVPQGV